MFKRQTTGSVVCASCRSLVGVNDEVCYNCGRRNPGLWGFGPMLRAFGNDLGFVTVVVYGCSALYVISLAFTVALGGKIYAKPANREHAADMLAALSGKRHEVLTGVALKNHDHVEFALSTSEVLFKPLSREEIAQYVASGEGDDKAGAYAIQGRAARFVVELRGSYSGVMGLPLYETAQLLDKLRERRNPY